VPKHLPCRDSQVLERVPARASDPLPRASCRRCARPGAPSRRTWPPPPGWPSATSTKWPPRATRASSGHAQAALAALVGEPPARHRAVRVLRAMLLQFDHQFEPALADLEAVTGRARQRAEAWAWRPRSRWCRPTMPAPAPAATPGALATPLLGAACRRRWTPPPAGRQAATSALRRPRCPAARCQPRRSACGPDPAGRDRGAARRDFPRPRPPSAARWRWACPTSTCRPPTPTSCSTAAARPRC
jgi:hypothetical protein